MNNNLPLVLVIDSQKASRDTIATVLHSHDVRIRESDSLDAALREAEVHAPDAILIDPPVDPQGHAEHISRLRTRLPDTPVIIVSDKQETRLVVDAMRQGVFDYLHKPVNAGALVLAVTRALEDKRLKDELRILKGRISGQQSLQVSMGDSDTVRTLVRLLDKIAPTPYTVLIEGESGSGKELVARAIHDMSRIADGPFVPIDCGAIPENLFESELFGYAKGAFTGAGRDKMGFFEAADNGTLFLDEVCNLSYFAQQKLLRVIEERRVQRLGSVSSRPVTVRIIAASNRSLDREVEERRFRVDLLHRLKEVFVKVPPLRERREDIGYLATRFLNEFRTVPGPDSPGLAADTLQILTAYPWPGNVRELKNVMRQAALVSDPDQPVLPLHLPGHIAASAGMHEAPSHATSDDDLLASMPDASLAEIVGTMTRRLEKRIIEQAIQEAGGNKAAAAKRLRIDYTTMHRKRKQLGIE